ncbi:MAG: ATP-binding cassette domain-containing protein, partial [Pirellulales bacterium]
MSTVEGTGHKEQEETTAVAARQQRVNAAPPVLEIHDMTVAYHRRPVLWDVDLSVEQPSLVGIVGPNGAGKSTLIKAVLGL